MRRRRQVLAAVAVAGAVFLGVTGVSHAGHDDPRRDDAVVVDKSRYLKTVSQLLKDLEELEERNEDNPNKNDRKWVRERLAEMRKDLAGVRSDLETAPPANTLPIPSGTLLPVPPPGPAAMTPAEFAVFEKELKKQSFDSNRLGLVREVSGAAWFTTDQVIAVMSQFSFSSEKIQAAAAMYPHVVDRDKWYTVYSTLSFSSDQEKLRKLTSGK